VGWLFDEVLMFELPVRRGGSRNVGGRCEGVESWAISVSEKRDLKPSSKSGVGLTDIGAPLLYVTFACWWICGRWLF